VNPVCAQFNLIGDADYMLGDCIKLTPDEPYASGMAYHERKLNLNQYFEIEFDIYFGDKDELGADGIAFVIHNDPRGYEAFGFWGEGLGYGRIYPSIAVEFDTYQNMYRNDPACDHVAYLENGLVYQNDYWNNDDAEYNLEDDKLHNFRFRWDPTEKMLMVYLDNNIVFQGQRDLIKEIFAGEKEVIWGFTASTGRKHNLQYFCLRKWTFNGPKVLENPNQAQWAFNKLIPIIPERMEYVLKETSKSKEEKIIVRTKDLPESSPQSKADNDF